MKSANFFLLFVLALVTYTFSSCEKLEKGVLEVRTESLLSHTYTYNVRVAEDDNDFPVESEFDANYLYFDPSMGSIYRYQAFYWPNKSASGLGYGLKSGVDEGAFVSKDGGPGKNGHWAGQGNGDGGGGGGVGSCPQGTWYSPACGDSRGVVWKFGSDKKGSFSNKDCNGICTPMVFTFSYSMSGSTCNITYDAVQPIVSCDGYADSRPPAPGSASITLSCSNNELTVTSGNGTQVFTK